MKKLKKLTIIICFTLLVTSVLTGCQKYSDTVQTCKISNISYKDQKALEDAVQPESLSADETIYASIHFIESPIGSEFTVKWFLDNSEIQTETKTTAKDCQDILVYELDKANIQPGTLKLAVSYKDIIIYSKELVVK